MYVKLLFNWINQVLIYIEPYTITIIHWMPCRAASLQRSWLQINTSGTNVAFIKNVSGQFPKYSTCVDFLKIFAFGRKDLAKQSLKSFLDSQEIFLTFWVSSSLLNQESWFPTFFSQIPLGRYVKAFSIYIKPTTYLSPSPPKKHVDLPIPAVK